MQLGRLVDGKLGGDGSFNDDGLLHERASRVVGENICQPTEPAGPRRPRLVAIVLLLNGRFADPAVSILAATLMGGFVLAPDDVADAIRAIWTTITGDAMLLRSLSDGALAACDLRRDRRSDRFPAGRGSR